MQKITRLLKIWMKNIIEEISSHAVFYILLSIIFILALFVRIYRTEDLMGFYYDQGRDALVIWKLWHEGKLFLTGPVTGLAGIFLGPLYYYLIAPFYLIGNGNPVFPSVFLSFTTVLSLIVLYIIGLKMQSRITGLIAVIIGGFSYYLVLAARWLSNPTPMFLLSMLILWNMWTILTNDQRQKTKVILNCLWVSLALLLGLSLQFESASAIFYLPVIVVFSIWQRKRLPEFKIITLSLFVFISTLLPQVLFDIRHGNIIFEGFKRVLVAEKSFRNPINIENIQVKIDYFWTVFDSKIFPNPFKYPLIFYGASVLGLIKIFKNNSNAVTLLLIFLTIPILFYFVFQGNEGNIYDYYMTGYYLPLVLLFSLGLSFLWNIFYGKIFIVIFLIVFLNNNINSISKYLTSPFGGEGGIALGTELQAVEWIYDNSKNTDSFNVDVYVPPVIPYSYEYLFLWKGTTLCGDKLCGFTKDKNVQTLYTLFEEDPPHPERLSSWLERQKGIGVIEKQTRFGNITVQRRIRI